MYSATIYRVPGILVVTACVLTGYGGVLGYYDSYDNINSRLVRIERKLDALSNEFLRLQESRSEEEEVGMASEVINKVRKFAAFH
ncbi:hypothetical protein ElyMa_005274900 [Elysia marginata]|uniref:Nematode cuticle collagen N-terminal domain-containing protein n=1 Tax=Elysia marginata TaxID=1093978 RepID=A0AAV4JXG1_9GAST|nr:hypothetical protein ElyMa_005274900 [Elysia marginata]